MNGKTSHSPGNDVKDRAIRRCDYGLACLLFKVAANTRSVLSLLKPYFDSSKIHITDCYCAFNIMFSLRCCRQRGKGVTVSAALGQHLMKVVFYCILWLVKRFRLITAL